MLPPTATKTHKKTRLTSVSLGQYVFGVLGVRIRMCSMFQRMSAAIPKIQCFICADGLAFGTGAAFYVWVGGSAVGWVVI